MSAQPIHRLLTPTATLNQGVTSVDQYRSAPILDQGPTGSCEGHRWAMGIHIAFRATGDLLPFFPSPAGLYTDGRLYGLRAGETLQDDGAATSDVVTAMQACGIRAMRGPTPDGRNSDVDPARVNDYPTITDLAEERLFPVGGVYGIWDGQPDVKYPMIQSALAQGYPVALDMICDTMFEHWGDGDTTQPLADCNPNDPTAGGHAILLTKMTVDASGGIVFEGPNSWGVGWGRAGYWAATNAWFEKAVDNIVVVEVKKVA